MQSRLRVAPGSTRVRERLRPRHASGARVRAGACALSMLLARRQHITAHPITSQHSTAPRAQRAGSLSSPPSVRPGCGRRVGASACTTCFSPPPDGWTDPATYARAPPVLYVCALVAASPGGAREGRAGVRARTERERHKGGASVELRRAQQVELGHQREQVVVVACPTPATPLKLRWTADPVASRDPQHRSAFVQLLRSRASSESLSSDPCGETQSPRNPWGG